MLWLLKLHSCNYLYCILGLVQYKYALLLPNGPQNHCVLQQWYLTFSGSCSGSIQEVDLLHLDTGVVHWSFPPFIDHLWCHLYPVQSEYAFIEIVKIFFKWTWCWECNPWGQCVGNLLHKTRHRKLALHAIVEPTARVVSSLPSIPSGMRYINVHFAMLDQCKPCYTNNACNLVLNTIIQYLLCIIINKNAKLVTYMILIYI